jgi:hypothetical protein
MTFLLFAPPYSISAVICYLNLDFQIVARDWISYDPKVANLRYTTKGITCYRCPAPCERPPRKTTLYWALSTLD